MATCKQPNCKNRSRARGLCPTHYEAWRRATMSGRDIEKADAREKPKDAGTLTFMGQTFESRKVLTAAFPAFSGDDAVRAIRDGATTPMEVEIACRKHLSKGRARSLVAARNSEFTQPTVARKKAMKQGRRKAA